MLRVFKSSVLDACLITLVWWLKNESISLVVGRRERIIRRSYWSLLERERKRREREVEGREERKVEKANAGVVWKGLVEQGWGYRSGEEGKKGLAWVFGVSSKKILVPCTSTYFSSSTETQEDESGGFVLIYTYCIHQKSLFVRISVLLSTH